MVDVQSPLPIAFLAGFPLLPREDNITESVLGTHERMPVSKMCPVSAERLEPLDDATVLTVEGQRARRHWRKSSNIRDKVSRVGVYGIEARNGEPILKVLEGVVHGRRQHRHVMRRQMSGSTKDAKLDETCLISSQ